jgi:hypothetical protein
LIRRPLSTLTASDVYKPLRLADLGYPSVTAVSAVLIHHDLDFGNSTDTQTVVQIFTALSTAHFASKQ